MDNIKRKLTLLSILSFSVACFICSFVSYDVYNVCTPQETQFGRGLWLCSYVIAVFLIVVFFAVRKHYKEKDAKKELSEIMSRTYYEDVQYYNNLKESKNKSTFKNELFIRFLKENNLYEKFMAFCMKNNMYG